MCNFGVLKKKRTNKKEAYFRDIKICFYLKSSKMIFKSDKNLILTPLFLRHRVCVIAEEVTCIEIIVGMY